MANIKQWEEMPLSSASKRQCLTAYLVPNPADLAKYRETIKEAIEIIDGMRIQGEA